MNSLSERDAYRRAGVDVGAADMLIGSIRSMAEATRRPGSHGSLGGFGAILDLAAAGFRDPLLVSGTDGVGTKLRIALDTGLLDGIGQDLVAMCVNDLLCHGAEPLQFLDYYGTGALDIEVARRVIAGIANACRRAGVELAGGETAELPGLVGAGTLELAGFAIGAVERDRLLPKTPGIGDAVIALPASGPHANGFALIRKWVAENGLDWRDPAPFDPGTTLAEALLTPTALYGRPALLLVRSGCARALAHVTGGGLTGNLPRVLADNQAVRLDPDSWELPPVFRWLQSLGRLSRREMIAVFNCGVGMAAICKDESEALRILRPCGIDARCIGRVVERTGDVVEMSGGAGARPA